MYRCYLLVRGQPLSIDMDDLKDLGFASWARAVLPGFAKNILLSGSKCAVEANTNVVTQSAQDALGGAN